ncbi:MAG: acyl-CoA dehydrogenase [Deltaproteobacteria bacterium]|nr:acyl-CoA dehydrogenase [Deltaproteobacteria bacterium]
MYIGYTPEQEALRDRLRVYFDELMTPELREECERDREGGGPLFREAMKQMGRDGWLGIGWPVEFGGQNRSAIEQFIFGNEVRRTGFPLPFLTLDTVGPTIARFGSEEQKQFFVPKILAGEIFFAIGYSEPSAGTDLAALTTRADRQGDEWVINGQKVFTSYADYADYIWLAARTDPEARKHAGISIFLVPTTAPGYSFSLIRTMSEMDTYATYYEDVRLPASGLVGPENGGWGLMTNQLNRERVGIADSGPEEDLYRRIIDYARERRLADGTRLIDRPRVRQNLGRVRAGLEANRLIRWKQAWATANDQLDPAGASAAKVYGSEFSIEAIRLLGEIAGQAGNIRAGSPEAVLQGQLEQAYRTASLAAFGGGTNEIQRDLISTVGLEMPRASR